MANYIYPAPGVEGVQLTLTVKVAGDTVGVVVPALQDVTVNNQTDVFSWEQLDSGSKLQVPTTATNSVDTTIVLDQATFFGEFTVVANEAALPTSGMTVGAVYYATAEASWHRATSATVTVELTSQPVAAAGLFGLSRDKRLITFDLYLGDESDGSVGKTISGSGYITGLAPTVAAASPVWTSPVSITVTGDFTVA